MTNYNIKFLFLLCACAIITSCSSDEIETPPTPGPDDTFEIYMGSKITFIKAPDADFSLEVNQDRINDNVWITRGAGGEIFNIKTESSSSKGSSPAGTAWALGTTSNISNLSFTSFRDAVNPQDAVGKNLVLHLIEEDAYIDVKFTSWTQGKSGGFTYERNTK